MQLFVILQFGKKVNICTINTCKRVHPGQNIINHKHIFAERTYQSQLVLRFDYTRTVQDICSKIPSTCVHLQYDNGILQRLCMGAVEKEFFLRDYPSCVRLQIFNWCKHAVGTVNTELAIYRHESGY